MNPSRREECRALRVQGHSIGQIANQCGLSKSVVHWHVRDLSLNENQRRLLYNRWRASVTRANNARRGRSIKTDVIPQPAWSNDLVHLVAHLSFDGSLTRYACRYYNRSESQARHIASLFEQLFGVKARLALRAAGVWQVSYYHVELAAWLRERETELSRIVRQQPDWKLQWLKAFFDDEGHVHVSGSVRRIRASQHQPDVLRCAGEFLQELLISSRIDQRARAIEITGRLNLERFSATINFSPGLAMNPERKNALWKRPIEKRAILALAIASYRHR